MKLESEGRIITKGHKGMSQAITPGNIKKYNGYDKLVNIKNMSTNRTDNPNIASGRIDFLEKDEIFVFGSNLEGKHLGGAAKAAHNKFGAQWGVGVGLTGQSYAIPTMRTGN